MTINRPTSRDDRQYHGLGGTPTYRSWYSMHDRCINPANESYPHYGAKGVTVCQRWDSIEAFVADMGLRPDGMTIDRMDRTKGYEPGNCRWATDLEQQRNRDGVKGGDGVAEAIRADVAGGMSQRACARLRGVNQSTVSRIVNGVTWGDLAEQK